MKDIRKIRSIFKEYILQFKSEVDRQYVFKNYLGDSNSSLLYDRKNFKGHITASAIIVNKDCSKVLLIKHKFLKRWLQPGGHIDASDDTILDATLREIKEEVSINKSDLRLVSFADDDAIPFDIDSHIIPINASKGEDEHYHYDFRYLFIYEGTEHIDIDLEEVSDYKWIEFDQISEDAEFKNVIKKVRRILNSDYVLKELD